MLPRKCPVCDWEIKDEAQQIKLEGNVILVCCDECAKKFKADPHKYIKDK